MAAGTTRHRRSSRYQAAWNLCGSKLTRLDASINPASDSHLFELLIRVVQPLPNRRAEFVRDVPVLERGIVFKRQRRILGVKPGSFEHLLPIRLRMFKPPKLHQSGQHNYRSEERRVGK